MLGCKVLLLYYKRYLLLLFRLQSAKQELEQQDVPARDLEANRASIKRTSCINYYVYRAS